ncbi:MAG: hypothetical protein NW208_10020 [Bryobacter sp.]|nr:hypothetical protein [Bryobacter sp.]
MKKEQIVAALRRLGSLLAERGVCGEINLLGGTAMVLAFAARQSTKDVDAIFVPTSEVREAAARVAEELGLSSDWLNDAVKGFVSDRGEFVPLPEFSTEALRVQAPTAEYLLAMKVMAARATLGGERGDREDIRFLIRELGIRQSEQVWDVVGRYYEPGRVAPRSLYLVEEILEEMEKEGRG